MFEVGDAAIYMKVGTHAQESLEDIIERKMREIDQAGYALWGYGGSTCHPMTMVQPFARQHALQSDRPIILAMQRMDSNHFAEPLRATEFSVDGKTWTEIPEAVSVRGSRYALVLGSLIEVDEHLSLSATKVAVGNSRGRAGNKYIRGRVDKACLEFVAPEDPDEEGIAITLAAELKDPFAVFVRN